MDHHFTANDPGRAQALCKQFIIQLMLKLKLQYFGHQMQRGDSLEKTLMLGKIEAEREEDDRGKDGWMASPT